MKNQAVTTLIVEDNPGDVDLLKEQLFQAGWPVYNSEHQSSLLDAVERLKDIQPSIVFLDLNLPDSNGLETFLTINAVAPEIPVIILSGMNDTSLCVQAVKAGAQDFLVKGEFEEKILLKTILYGIERKKNQLRIQEANMRYDLASRATNDPLWDWDLRSNQILWNDKAKIFGYNEGLRKNHMWRMAAIHPDDREEVQAGLETCLKGGEDKWSAEYRFVCSDGSCKNIFDRGYIVRDRHQAPYRMIGTMQDITEKVQQQKQMEEERKKQQHALIKANIAGQEKERDRISKELHDNVNQILTGVKLHLALIKKWEEAYTPDTIKKCVEYLDTAIKEIRQLAHAMSSSVMKDIGVVDAINALKNEINILQVCRIKFVYTGDFSCISNDTSLSLFRIVQEHLGNIIKHSKATDVTINLDVVDEDIRLNIIDNGIGADLADKKKMKGIGLLNMYNRVQSHNGIIDINSSPGNGFEILISIPYIKREFDLTG